MAGFEKNRRMHAGDASVSIKVRIASGCYHREHSPRAYKIIDKALYASTGQRDEFVFIEHESGPEILTIVATGLSIVASVTAIVAVIINARSKGIKEGDHPSHPLELIVRRADDNSGLKEETILRIPCTQEVSQQQIAEVLHSAVNRLLAPTPPMSVAPKKSAKPGKKEGHR